LGPQIFASIGRVLAISFFKKEMAKKKAKKKRKR
jgi:hypothetical protein